VIFYALVVLLAAFVHSRVQTLTDNVSLRGRVFMINFLTVVVLAARVAQLAFEGGLR